MQSPLVTPASPPSRIIMRVAHTSRMPGAVFPPARSGPSVIELACADRAASRDIEDCDAFRARIA